MTGEQQCINEIQCMLCRNKYDTNSTIFFNINEEAGMFICENCIKNMSNTILDIKKSNVNDINIDYKKFSPKFYKEYLDKYIISQENAKKIFSVAIYNHLKKIYYNETHKDNNINLEKSNILMVGPSGVGKTFMIETICNKLNIPYSISDATTLTEAGYVGSDVEIILSRLIQNAGGDIKKAEQGIVFIDEIDKLGRKGENPSLTRDVGSEGVQQALLKMLDGTIVDVPLSGNRKHPMAECVKINTKNILFICSGAFEGIDKIIKNRLYKASKASILNNNISDKDISFNELIHQVNDIDLRKFGMIPEILGRLPNICTFENLDEEDLIKILTEPKNAIIKQYKKLFELDDVEIDFEYECLKAIANKAIEYKTGARSLRGILEKYMKKYMYEIPSNKNIGKILFTKDSFINNKEPIFVERRD